MDSWERVSGSGKIEHEWHRAEGPQRTGKEANGQSGGFRAPPREDYSAETRLRETVRKGAEDYEAFSER
jgi:hypothetical protein